jgi:hypothetical protein
VQTVLFVLAGAALVVAFALRSLKPDKAGAAWGAFGAGVVLAVAAFIAPQIGGGSDVSLRIVSPKDGASVPADGVDVQVEVTGGELASSAADSGGHIHVYVDGSVTSMPYGDRAMVKLEPGEHELAVEYVDAAHTRLDPPVRDTIEVTAE